MNDSVFMKAALKEASKAAFRSEVPVGAIVVRDGRIVARGHNKPIESSDPTAHAEIVALRQAARKAGNYRLPDCDLYVTVEPCAMCLGALVQARIRRLVFGTLDFKGGAVSSIMKFPFERANHHPEIIGGILADECAKILRDFFHSRRKK
jgi:tRNA(adenine34) deaminase